MAKKLEFDSRIQFYLMIFNIFNIITFYSSLTFVLYESRQSYLRKSFETNFVTNTSVYRDRLIDVKTVQELDCILHG